jgi:hypothetical protein
MEYCPYCAERVPANAKTCPSCKKAIDISQIESLYDDDTVELNSRVARSLWFKEHSRFIYPIIFLIIGLAAGAAFAYSYSLIHFANKQNDYEQKIQDLQKTINDNASQASQNSSSLQQIVDQKDQQIAILQNQRRFMSQIINFTRRLADNSTITTADPSQTDYYRRNMRYLINQYSLESEKMVQLGVEDAETFNLQTVPQLLSE